MSQYDWTKEVTGWISKRRNTTPELAEEFVRFFRRAFQNTRDPQEAWFGAHTSTLSLVVGGIFLAAVVSSGRDKGIWLLADEEMPKVKGIRCKPVKSTQSSETPLVWIHANSFESVGDILKATEIWESYSRASEKIFNSPISASRDKLQKERGKKRLSDLLRSSTAEPE